MSENSFEVIDEDSSKFRDKIDAIDGFFYLKRSYTNKEYIGEFSSREEARIAALIFKNNGRDLDYFKNHNLFKYGDKFYIFKLMGNVIRSYDSPDLDDALLKINALNSIKDKNIKKDEKINYLIQMEDYYLVELNRNLDYIMYYDVEGVNFYLKNPSGERLGKFHSINIIKLLITILSENNWDIDYLRRKNIFRYGGKYYIFKVHDNEVILNGTFSSISLALSHIDDSINFNRTYSYLTTKNKLLIKKQKSQTTIPNPKKDIKTTSKVENIIKEDIKNEEPIGHMVRIAEDVECIGIYYSMRKVDDSEISSKDVTFRNNLRYNYKTWEEGKDETVLNKFTEQLAMRIVEISKKINKNIIGLISAPSSKKDKTNTIVKSIEIIKKWDESGRLNQKYGFSKKIEDFSHILKRIEDVESSSNVSSRNQRTSYDEHVRTIVCSEDLSKYDNMCFIVLDDVYTQGFTMKACRYHITKNGVNNDDLFYLTIGKTYNNTIKYQYGD